MRVNSRVFSERTDMFNGIKIPNCPSQFKVIAENIVNMMIEPGFAFGEYNTMTMADKMMMLYYWREYDGLIAYKLEGEFDWWFIKQASAPELIRRARQWLCEHNYLIPLPSVSERAYEAGEKFRQTIRH